MLAHILARTLGAVTGRRGVDPSGSRPLRVIVTQ